MSTFDFWWVGGTCTETMDRRCLASLEVVELQNQVTSIGLRNILLFKWSRRAFCTINFASPTLASSSARLHHISISGQPFCNSRSRYPKKTLGRQKTIASGNWNLASKRAEAGPKLDTRSRSETKFAPIALKNPSPELDNGSSQIWNCEISGAQSR